MFTIKIKVPTGRTVRVPEIKNKEYLSLLKFCQNEDIEGLSSFFEDTIFSKIHTSGELTIIDRLYILIYLRMVFVEPNIFFKDNRDTNINFNLSNILKKIDDHESDYTKTVSRESFTLDLGLPNMLYYNDIDDLFIGAIKRIQIKDKVLDFSNITKEERESILGYLPADVFKDISNYIKEISHNVRDFIIIEKNETLNIDELNLDITTNGVIGFILALFTQNLKTYYELMYFFMCKLLMPHETFINLTPIETKVMINIYEKELEEKRKAELQNNSR
jgi:hypothetical protein